MCKHRFVSIVLDGISRYQCEACDLVAPPCFVPIPESMADYRKILDEMLDQYL